MLSSFRFLALACCLFATLAWVSGCENKPVTQTPTETSKSEDGHNHSHDHDHDHDHSNMSLGDAAKEIVSLQTAIAEAFAANDPEKAHDPLHEVGHIIGVLEDAGKKASLSEADAAELKATKDALMDAFAKVDGAMHGDGETKYSDVAEQVEKSIATLKKLAKIE
jgi:ABC-type Zn2+ transport system substrate-binding protein/surface adhesin